MTDDDRQFESLLRQLQAGSPDAARELTHTYGGHLRRCVRYRLNRRLRMQFESIDIMQLVWQSVFAEPAKLAAIRDTEQFVSFLAGIVRNKLLEFDRHFKSQRKNSRREVPLEDDASDAFRHPPSRDPTPSAAASFREQWQEWVQQQPLETGQVVELRYEGNTFDEIAAVLDIHESTARKVLRRLQKRHAEALAAKAAAGGNVETDN